MGPIEIEVHELVADALMGTAIATVTLAAEHGNLVDVMQDLPEEERYKALVACCTGLLLALKRVARAIDDAA